MTSEFHLYHLSILYWIFCVCFSILSVTYHVTISINIATIRIYTYIIRLCILLYVIKRWFASAFICYDFSNSIQKPIGGVPVLPPSTKSGKNKENENVNGKYQNIPVATAYGVAINLFIYSLSSHRKWIAWHIECVRQITTRKTKGKLSFIAFNALISHWYTYSILYLSYTSTLNIRSFQHPWRNDFFTVLFCVYAINTVSWIHKHNEYEYIFDVYISTFENIHT